MGERTGGDKTEEAAGATSCQAVKEPIRVASRASLLTVPEMGDPRKNGSGGPWSAWWGRGTGGPGPSLGSVLEAASYTEPEPRGQGLSSTSVCVRRAEDGAYAPLELTGKGDMKRK